MQNPLKFLRKDILFFAVIVLASLLAGLLMNHFREKPLPLAYASKQERLDRAVSEVARTSQRPASASPALPDILNLEQFADFVENRRGLVLDARYRIEYQLAHVPGALSLPRDEFAEAYAVLKGQLEKDRSQPIVVYCDGKDCEDSKLVQKALRDLGYSQIAIYKGGWAEWTAAGKPKEAIR
jgi:rhodanese-related sulfurtransferase